MVDDFLLYLFLGIVLQKYYYALPIITRQLTFGLWDASPVNFTQRGHFSQVYTINTVWQNIHFGLESNKHKNESMVTMCLYCVRCGLTFPERLCNSGCRNSLKSKQGWLWPWPYTCKNNKETSTYDLTGTSEIDQLYKVASVLGTPGRNDWSEGFGLANAMNFRFPTFQATHLSSVLGSRTSARAVSFLYAMLAWNPSWRSSAQEALRHSYFRMANPNSKQTDNMTLPFDTDKPDGNSCSTDSTTESMLSLSLRPRNNLAENSKEAIYNNNNNRVPLPLTEIEPHYSRDLSRPVKQEEQRPKSPVQPTQTGPPKEDHLIKDHDDLNDLISAFSLDSSKRRNSRSKVLIFSPSKTKVSSINGSPALRLQQSRARGTRNNGGPQRTFQLQNAYNFSPTTTKFTLLYGHHQPTTFKIVSPTKLGLDNNSKSQEKSKLMEEIMGKRSKLFSNNNHTNNSPVFRSLPDFSNSPISSKSKPKTPPVKRRLLPLAADINVNGRGLGEPAEKPKLQVRPDWAAKYLKWYF